MEDNQLISELERLSRLKDAETELAYNQLIENIGQRAAAHQLSNRHWLGISLLARARSIIAPRTELDRMMALVLGGKAELLMRWADGLHIPIPEDLLSLVETDLREANNVDPTLADPYWDFAVIYARYRADYATAAMYLMEAKNRNYAHPMMATLETIIQAHPVLASAPDTDETALCQLILRLAEQATGPMASRLLDEEESQLLTVSSDRARKPQTFGDYVRAAKSIAGSGNLSRDQCLRILSDSMVVTGDSSEFVTDLLRRTAEELGEPEFLDRATDLHLQKLRDMAFQLFAKREEDAVWLRRSRRAAQRGLDIVEKSRATIDRDLHADLLIAKGQALYYEDQRYVNSAIRCYHDALRLKREVGNASDVEQLKGLLSRQIDHRRGQAIFSTYMGGVGEALEILRVCDEVAADLGDLRRAMDVKVELASILRQVGQHPEAEEILLRVMESSPPEHIARNASFELASIYSETSRPREAVKIQRQLLDAGGMNDDHMIAVLWSNYANSLRLLNDFDAARVALEKAWELLPTEQKQKVGNTVPTQGARIQVLFAQVDFDMRHHAEALKHIMDAEALDSSPLGFDGLHFHQIKATCLFAAGRMDEAKSALDTAIHNLGFLLKQGPSLPSWESLLQQWSRLDVMSVRAHLGSSLDDRFEKGLLRAEAAKGRVLAWLERWGSPEGTEEALALDRQVKALETARQWLSARQKRRIVSLFGSDEGLGVFNVEESGQVTGAWLADFNYDLLRRDVHDPWVRLVRRALSDGDSDTLALAGSLTNYLLDLVGMWLWRVQPSLAEGGTDLVLIPHRLFRTLPLVHARLPTGQLLSDLFETVVITPSLGHLARGLKQVATNVFPSDVIAFADADSKRPLRFARCEAILSGAAEHLFIGNAVTTNGIAGAFGHQGILLLSLHGDFNEENPFRSAIFTADGHFPLHQLTLGQTPVRCHIVVLGACEAGRARSSLSDEPLGFPTMLLESNVPIVVAPTWQVDDFAAFLFVSKMFDTINRGADIYRAVGETVRWLREVTANEVLEQTDYLIKKVMDYGEQGKLAVETLEPQLKKQKAWIENLKPTEKPFRSPLDWSAFQIMGIPPLDTLPA